MITRQIEVRTRGGFAAHVATLPDREHHDVCVSRRGRRALGAGPTLVHQLDTILRRVSLERCAQRRHRSRARERVPRAEHARAVIGERTDQRDALRTEWQHRAVVQEHERLDRRPPCKANMLGIEGRRCGSLVNIRPLEEAERELHAQHATYRLVDQRLDPAGGDERLQLCEIQRALHVHIDAGGERFLRGRRAVVRDAMRDQLFDQGPVADDETAKLPFPLQHLIERERIRARRNIVECIEPRHQRCDAGAHGRLERRHVHLAQQALRDVRRVVVATAFGRAITHVVLRARG